MLQIGKRSELAATDQSCLFLQVHQPLKRSEAGARVQAPAGTLEQGVASHSSAPVLAPPCAHGGHRSQTGRDRTW